MRLAFTKMQGLGNDFIVLDATRAPIALTQEQIRFLADRRFGIGCDQLLMVEPPRNTLTDFHYRIFNADGGEVEQCGNGARCFARFVRDLGLTKKDVIDVGTASGNIRLYVGQDGQVRVNMGSPVFSPEKIPFLADSEAESYPLEINGATFRIGAVSMGNPHAILLVDDCATAPVETLGPLIESHPHFPQRVNVGFMAVRFRDHIDLRVFERGSGETLACGTGACAAMVIGHHWGLLDEQARVSLPGGDLMLGWSGPGEPVWMKGAAERVFDGIIEL
ncbi:MAG: diaminopimelate epimerase [Gammaproteobacteria bacterium]|nr:diaminopimelate epimerase [Gammaproteobacteria bacterium]MBU1656231.1 diaminopimelate epimerase [Gammaproteobacteria bacterium]MBU1959796.1 diaminopimelate epimerase [Gammaproteobacteria bacterium]